MANVCQKETGNLMFKTEVNSMFSQVLWASGSVPCFLLISLSLGSNIARSLLRVRGRRVLLCFGPWLRRRICRSAESTRTYKRLDLLVARTLSPS